MAHFAATPTVGGAGSSKGAAVRWDNIFHAPLSDVIKVTIVVLLIVLIVAIFLYLQKLYMSD